MWYLNSVVYPCYLVDSFLTKDECLAITNEYSDKVEESKVVGNIINKKIRKSDNFWIPVDETTEWLYRKLTDGITFVNKKNFNNLIKNILGNANNSSNSKAHEELLTLKDKENAKKLYIKALEYAKKESRLNNTTLSNLYYNLANIDFNNPQISIDYLLYSLKIGRAHV